MPCVTTFVKMRAAAGVCLLLVLLGIACQGNGPSTPSDYFSELNDLSASFYADSDLVGREFAEAVEGEDSVQGQAAAFGVMSEEFARLYPEFANDLRGLQPPESVRGIHETLVVEAKALGEDSYPTALKLLEDVETEADMRSLIESVFVEGPASRLNDACNSMQRAADDGGFDLDLLKHLDCF